MFGSMSGPLVAFIGAPGPLEIIVIASIALLLFGKRIPEVARNLGRGIVEFKKGVSDSEDEPESPESKNEP